MNILELEHIEEEFVIRPHLISREIDGHIPTAQLLIDYWPDRDWFTYDSDIHGEMHSGRVFILQELLLQYIKKSGVIVQEEPLRWAAALHDVKRVHDGVDPEHGVRAASWIRSSDSPIQQVSEKNSIANLVAMHADPDLSSMSVELAILKDADALDRVRSNDLDISFLRFDFSRRYLLPLAEQLYRKSQHVDMLSPRQTIVKAGIDLGLLIPTPHEIYEIDKSRFPL